MPVECRLLRNDNPYPVLENNIGIKMWFVTNSDLFHSPLHFTAELSNAFFSSNLTCQSVILSLGISPHGWGALKRSERNSFFLPTVRSFTLADITSSLSYSITRLDEHHMETHCCASFSMGRSCWA